MTNQFPIYKVCWWDELGSTDKQIQKSGQGGPQTRASVSEGQNSKRSATLPQAPSSLPIPYLQASF